MQPQCMIALWKYVKSEKCEKPFLKSSRNDDILSREKENEFATFIVYQVPVQHQIIYFFSRDVTLLYQQLESLIFISVSIF